MHELQGPSGGGALNIAQRNRQLVEGFTRFMADEMALAARAPTYRSHPAARQ